MKQTLLMIVLALGMCSISVNAQVKKQSSAKRTTTARSAKTQQGGQVMKFRQVGKDGYIWYKLKKGNLFGARDAEGNNIIPIKYDEVSYYCNEFSGTHFFIVKSGDFLGGYTRQGTLVVSPARHYTSLWLTGQSGKVCWTAEKNGGARQIVLDAKGNEAFSLECDLICMTSSFDGNSKFTNVQYFSIVQYSSMGKNKKEGICDLNGNIICPPEYDYCFLDDYGKTLKRKGEPDKSINYSANSRFNYSPYEDLYYAFTESSSSSTSSPSSSSSSSSNSSASLSSSNSSSSNSNSGNSTTTIHVEHHRDPVPVQQWQACFACGGMGTMGCDFCGGSGTKYIGDRLHRCSRCNGRGIIPCNVCYGNKGQYITVYK